MERRFLNVMMLIDKIYLNFLFETQAHSSHVQRTAVDDSLQSHVPARRSWRGLGTLGVIYELPFTFV